MKLKNFLFVVGIGTITLFTSCEKANPEMTSEEVLKHIDYLASDELAGRYPGTHGDTLAASYIKDQFLAYGLDLLGENGYQYFDAIAGLDYDEANYIKTGDDEGVQMTDFIPYPYSESGDFKAAVIFAGFGLELNSDSLNWNDYAGLDVKGKWVMMFRGDPESSQRMSAYEEFSDDKTKIVTAKDKGAIGVIMISSKMMEKEDVLIPAFYDKSSANIGIPVVNITRAYANRMIDLISYGQNIEQVEDLMISSNSSLSFDIPVEFEAKVQLNFRTIKTQNILAKLTVNPDVEDYFIVGAHYDHLGMGGEGSGSRVPDTIAVHNGADDNASGVAGVIEIAGKLASMKSELKHNFIFVAFGAEELGLLGSKYFSENSPVDLNKVNAMINFDMIGRLDTTDYSISVSGSGTSIQSDSILKAIAPEHAPLQFAYSPEGFGSSDHSSFYVKDVPVFFISTGAHPDYHTPKDDAEYIDPKGSVMVLDYTLDLIKNIESYGQKLTFQEAGPKERTGGRRGFKVTLGIMPDFTGSSNDGLRVDYVREGGPAFKAGMLKGDVIVAMEGMEVTNIQDYMVRLKKFTPGQRVNVDVRRNNELVVLIVDL